MIIDVTEVGEDEERLHENVGYRKPSIDETRINSFDRKMILVGLFVALFFVGGAMYAWQGSELKGSVGQAVQDVPIDKVAGDAGENNSPAPVVTRTTTGVERKQMPLIQVITPNGGETFCSSQAFRITWRYANVENVQVSLEAESKRYFLGMAPATGGVFPDLMRVPASQGAVYRVVVADEQGRAQDASDSVFAIQDCHNTATRLQ